MSALPPIKRFVLEDFAGVKEIPDFCSKFFYPLNLFLTSTYSALNNGVTIAANTLGVLTSPIAVTSDANGQATTTVNWKYPQSPPRGVVVMSCTLAGVSTLIPHHSWTYASGVVTVSMQFVKLSGGAMVASPSQTLSVTLWVNGG